MWLVPGKSAGIGFFVSLSLLLLCRCKDGRWRKHVLRVSYVFVDVHLV